MKKEFSDFFKKTYGNAKTVKEVREVDKKNGKGRYEKKQQTAKSKALGKMTSN